MAKRHCDTVTKTMTCPRKNEKPENIIFDKSKGFSFVMDDMTDEEYFDFLKSHSIMMRKGADDENQNYGDRS